MLKKLSKYMKGLWGLAAISAAGMIVEALGKNKNRNIYLHIPGPMECQ